MTHFTACQGTAMPCQETAMERCERELAQKFKHLKTGTEIPLGQQTLNPFNRRARHRRYSNG